MAVSFIANDSDKSIPNASSYTHSVNLNTSGSDRGTVIVFTGRRNVIRTLTSVTLDGVSGTVFTNVGADGGNACFVAIAFWKDSELPSSSAAYNVIPTWSGAVQEATTQVIELAGVDQTTVLSGVQSATAVTQTAPFTLGTTQTGATGEFLLTAGATCDNTDADDPSGHVKPSATTLVELISQGRIATGSAYDTSVSTSPETFNWDLDPSTTDTAIQSLLSLSFLVDAATGGTTTPVSASMTAIGTASISSAIIFSKDLTYTANGTSSLSKLFTAVKTLTLSGIGTSAISKLIRKSFSPSSTGSGAVIKEVKKTLPVTVIGTAGEDEALIIPNSTSYTATGTLATITNFIAGTGAVALKAIRYIAIRLGLGL